jgi:ferritin-like protein
MASTNYHEPPDLLSEETRNLHRAIVSLMEEWEAIDWYQQRADACSDPQLKEVLTHNKNEEIEHATMLLEWIRRHEMLRRFLFTDAPITGIEKDAEAHAAAASPEAALGIGSMKKAS